MDALRDWIPLDRPDLGEAEVQAVARVLRDANLVGDGLVCKRVENKMQEMFQIKHVLLTTSCSHALEMAMLAINIQSGDEVILPSFTFSSCANAIALRGAKPVFAEICPKTLNLDPEDVRRRITPFTKAIMPVHYAGVGCEMGEIMAIAEKHGLYVVEDAAQGVDAKYNGRYLGTIGNIGCYSFHQTKNIVCGEGGAFLTNDDKIAWKAEIIREKGTNRSAFIRGEVDKYTWVGIGSSYVLSDLLASVLEVQLEKRAKIKKRRKEIWEAYYRSLLPLAEAGRIALPVIPPDRESNYHLFYFHVPSPRQRDYLIGSLRAEKIGAAFHFVPLHSAPYIQQKMEPYLDLPVTSCSSATLIRLPLFPGLSDSDVKRVIAVTAAVIAKSAA